VTRLVELFKQQGRKCRMGKLVDEIGLDELRTVIEETSKT